jgi:hypothetical protein
VGRFTTGLGAPGVRQMATKNGPEITHKKPRLMSADGHEIIGPSYSMRQILGASVPVKCDVTPLSKDS